MYRNTVTQFVPPTNIDLSNCDVAVNNFDVGSVDRSTSKILCRLELTFVLLDVLLLKTIYKNVRVQIYLLWIVYCWFWTYFFFLSFKHLIKRQSYKINYLKVGLPVKKTLTAKFPPHSVDNRVLLLHVYVHSVESNWSFVTLKSGDKQTHLLL